MEKHLVLSKDKLLLWFMIICLIIILILPIAIIVCLSVKSNYILSNFGFFDLISGSAWQPNNGSFGYFPFIISSVYVSIFALIIAGPFCILTALYTVFYSSRKLKKIIYIIIDLLSGIPSVIYGVWGVLIIVPFISNYAAPFFGVSTTGYTLITGALVLALMVTPFAMNILLESFNSIPNGLIDASFSLGAGKWETLKKVVLKKSFPGIISAFVLSFARAFGETIAVMMVIGNIPIIPKGIFQGAYPLTALIANNYGEMMSIKTYDSALMFAALLLFIIVMVFNLFAKILLRNANKNIS